MLPSPTEYLRRFSYWAGLRVTLPISLLRGQCGVSGFGILMYHRVCEPVVGIPQPTWNVTPDRLRKQLEYLLQRGYEPWRLNDLVERARNGLSIPRRAFAVTFDDGYRCVVTEALPILTDLQIPATFFVATGLLGATGRMAQDDWVAAGDARVPIEQYEAMSLVDCDRIVEHPLFDLGSHTHSHQDFRGREDDFEEDLNQSLALFRARWGGTGIPFAFPYGCTRRGFCSFRMREVVRRVGYSCGLTADCQIIDPVRDDIYGWGRINVSNWDSGRVLAAKLDNWYGALKRFGLNSVRSLSFC